MMSSCNADGARFHLQGRRDQLWFLKNFVQREQLGGEVHPLSAAQREPAVVDLHSAGAAYLRLRPPLLRILAYLLEQRTRPPQKYRGDDTQDKTDDESQRGVFHGRVIYPEYRILPQVGQ
jgi:hypothetical protein